MANAKRCDRCGTFYEPVLDDEKVAYFHEYSSTHKLYDLCPSCLKDFAIFLSDPQFLLFINDTHFKDEAP